MKTPPVFNLINSQGSFGINNDNDCWFKDKEHFLKVNNHFGRFNQNGPKHFLANLDEADYKHFMRQLDMCDECTTDYYEYADCFFKTLKFWAKMARIGGLENYDFPYEPDDDVLDDSEAFYARLAEEAD